MSVEEVSRKFQTDIVQVGRVFRAAPLGGSRLNSRVRTVLLRFSRTTKTTD